MRTDLAILSLLAWMAFLVSRTFQRRNIPELVAFLFVGAVFGPSGVGLMDEADLQRLEPLTEVALAVLMFMVGERVSLRALRGSWWVAGAGAASYLAAAILVGAVASFLHGGMTALLLAVLAGAGAPMTVQSVVSSVRARGSYARAVVGSHAVADALAALSFSIALPIALRFRVEDVDTSEAVQRFLQLGVGGAVLGIVMGMIVARLSVRTETTGELLLLALVHLVAAATLSEYLGLSLPLAALVMGGVAATVAPTDASQRVFVSVRSVEQPLYLVFFALAGASIHIDEIPEVGLLGIGYIVARALGKFAGGFLGGLLGHLPARRAAYLGGDLIPQAGVAVGLAVLAAEAVPVTGSRVATVVLGSVVVFELVGPILVSRSLRSIKAEPEAERADPEEVDEELPSQMLLASTASLDVPSWVLGWCARTGSELTILAPEPPEDVEEDGQVDVLRKRAAQEGVPVHRVSLRPEATFSSTVVDLAKEMHAGMVIVVTPPLDNPSLWMRAGPVDRIAQRLTCPVLLLPGKSDTAADALAEMEIAEPDAAD